jgi:hypothetical protein
MLMICHWPSRQPWFLHLPWGNHICFAATLARYLAAARTAAMNDLFYFTNCQLRVLSVIAETSLIELR